MAKTTRAIDTLRRAFRDKRREARLPEGLVLYFPPLTTAARNAALSSLGEKPEATTAEEWNQRRNVLQVIHLAELEDGSPAFTPGDEHYLMTEVSYTTIQAMVTAMYMAGLPDPPQDAEEGKGGSARTRNSGS